MNRRREYFVLISLWCLVAWSVTSLALGRPTATKKYGAGTIYDCCDDFCWLHYQYSTQCYHDYWWDTCDTTRCIIHSYQGCKCNPNSAAGENKCPFKWSSTHWWRYLLVRKNTTCTSDDWSTGWKPCIDWGVCEYGRDDGGRCFSTNGCVGDFDWDREDPGTYICDN